MCIDGPIHVPSAGVPSCLQAWLTAKERSRSERHSTLGSKCTQSAREREREREMQKTFNSRRRRREAQVADEEQHPALSKVGDDDKTEERKRLKLSLE